jgi:hypothetical protein
VGCGDGKYFGVNPNVVTVGCDMSLNLLQVSKASGFDTFCSDAVKIPLLRYKVTQFLVFFDLTHTPSPLLYQYLCFLFNYFLLTSNSFDAVICIAVLHHISTLGKVTFFSYYIIHFPSLLLLAYYYTVCIWMNIFT